MRGSCRGDARDTKPRLNSSAALVWPNPAASLKSSEDVAQRLTHPLAVSLGKARRVAPELIIDGLGTILSGAA